MQALRVPAPALLAAVGGALLALPGCEEVSVNVMEVAVMELSPDELTVYEAEERQISAVLRASGGHVLTGRTVVWRSDDPGIAEVSPRGVVRGGAPGATRVRAESEGVEEAVPVTVLRRPMLALTPSELAFQGISGRDAVLEETVAVTNEGHGELSGLSAVAETEDGAGWLSARLDGSVAPAVLTVEVTAQDLAPERYEGVVRVRSPEAANSPRGLRVTLQVISAPPEVLLDPPAISFSSTAGSREPASQAVQVLNAGDGVLDELSATVRYQDGPVGWLTAELESAVAPTVLDLEALARGLGPGAYRAEVEVSSPAAPGASGIVTVTFEVGPAGGLSPDLPEER